MVFLDKMLKLNRFYFIFVLFYFCINSIYMYALPGKIDFILNEETPLLPILNRGMYNGTEIKLKLSCESDTRVRIGWLIRESPCIDEFFFNSDAFTGDLFNRIFDSPEVTPMFEGDYVYFKRSPVQEYVCTNSYIELNQKDLVKIEKIPIKKTNVPSNRSNVLDDLSVAKRQADSVHVHGDTDTIAKTWGDGTYLILIKTEPIANDESYALTGTIAFEYRHGYLSGTDWPFLPFYGVMCGIYIVYALVWFACSCMYWRDILRIQFWIGGVILLGMIEKAAYLAEYESINHNGYTFKIGLITAEFISCLKRSLARMLVIIVSLGFGIVKPRLGPTLRKVVGVGVLYFVLAALDGTFRILDRKEDTDSKAVIAGIPLVIIDISICYWILSSLQQTMRTLRVRRNVAKLSLYRHFTNTLIFCVIASLIFMIWSLKAHRFVSCLKDWKELWLDEGFWHILFSFILLVIIILWRPSNNSQRFIFSPLIDNEEDADDMDDQENEVFDSIKMRSKADSSKPTKKELKDKSIEDELKWVEEHVPATFTETTLPGIVDSEEEAQSTKLEMSKMD